MGMSGSKTTAKSSQTNKPVYAAEIGGAAKTLADTYSAQAPKIAGYADAVGALVPSLVERFTAGDPALTAARGYITDTLRTDEGNPFLDDMVAMSGDRVRNQVQASMGTRGTYGGSDYAGVMARELARNETGLRYGDWQQRQGMKAQAAGMVPGVLAAEYMPLAQAMGAGSYAAGLPMQGALGYAAGTGGLLGSYQNVNGTQVQKSNPGLMGIAGMGLQAASLFSDRRLKTDVRRVGATDEGTPVYTYRYLGTGPFHMGVMADDVPEARGADVDGFATVDYGKVR